MDCCYNNYHSSGLLLPCVWDIDMRALLRQELHVFYDASELGLLSAIYVQYFYANSVVVQLALAKARVKPAEFTSVPRLELAASLMAVNAAKTAAEGLYLDPDPQISPPAGQPQTPSR